MNVGRFDGEVVMVTGGARGIGRACVERFVSEGAISLEAASLEPGARITGSFEGELFQTNCYE